MKTILTTITFAIAVMVFAFNAAPAQANEDIKCDFADCSDPNNHKFPKIVEVEELDPEDQVADSGEEGSTSAAGTNDE